MDRVKDKAHDLAISSTDERLVLSELERDQLAEAKTQHFGRLKLKGFQIFLLWLLRIYAAFMAVVILYEVVSGHH